MFKRAYLWFIPLFLFIAVIFVLQLYSGTSYTDRLVPYTSSFVSDYTFTTLKQHELTNINWYPLIKSFMNDYTYDALLIPEIKEIAFIQEVHNVSPTSDIINMLVRTANVFVQFLNGIRSLLNTVIYVINNLIENFKFVFAIFKFIINLPLGLVSMLSFE